MEYVNWTIFIWITGIGSALLGIMWKYMKDEIYKQNKKINHLETEVEDIKESNNETKIRIAEIQKDIEFIKKENIRFSDTQQEILKELRNKN